MMSDWLQVQVLEKRLEANDVYSYELVDPNGGRLPTFSAGSHIDVETKEGVVRQYSLCNDPSEDRRYVIAVLLESTGRGGSLTMHREVHKGDRIRIGRPRNHFPLEPSATRSLLFAGGIGITPILCMAERLASIGAEFEMHYCTRTVDRTPFRERIRHSDFSDRVRIYHDDRGAGQMLRLDTVLKNPERGMHLYVCGPAGFMDSVLGTAKAMAWPDHQLHREYFAPSAQQGETGSFEVQIASSGQIYRIPPDQPITAVLAQHGIEIPTSCGQGVCGTCLTRVLGGEPHHRDCFLTNEERARNDRMLLCCSRAISARIVLEL